MRMTLKKLGELAGVSSACVSNILNGKTQEYTDETIARVKKIANEYNYRPNSIAKSMVTKSTMTLGLILPDISNPYFPELAKGVENKAFELGYNIIYLNSDEDILKERMAFRTLDQKMVDGVIFIPSINSIENREIIEKFSVPIVTIDRLLDIAGIMGEVVSDDYQGSRTATRYLIQNGHKEILVLSGDRYMGMRSARICGFCDEMKENGLTVKKENIIFGKYKVEFGYQAMTEFLKQERALDAVYACSDMIAIGVLQALGEAGLSVPKDVSLMGYDDIYMSQYLHPPLTTMNQPKFAMGEKAVEMMVGLIQKNDRERQKLTLESSLVVRKSIKKKRK